MRAILHDSFRLAVEGSGLLVALGLPVCFNPYSEWPFEPTKVLFFQWTVVFMSVASILLYVIDRRIHLQTPDQHLQPRRSPCGNPLAIPVTAYAASLFLSSVFSVDPYRSFWGRENGHGLLSMLAVLVFFMLIEPRLRSKDYAEHVVTALLLGSVPIAVYAIVQFVGLDPLEWETDSISQTMSTLGRPNFLGAYMVMVIPFTLLRMVSMSYSKVRSSRKGSQNKGQLKSIWVQFPWRVTVLLLLQTVCVVLSQARAAWLSLIGAVCLFGGILSYVHRRRSFLLVPIGTLTLGLILYIGLSRIDLGSLGASASLQVDDVSFSDLRRATVLSRVKIWRHTLDLIQERWLIGHGPESFAEVFESQYPSKALWGSDNIQVTHPHNVVLEHLFSVGVLGISTWFIIIGVFLRRTLGRLRGTTDRYEQLFQAAVLSSAAAFLVQGQFNPEVIVVTVFFWLIMAMGVSRSCHVRERL